MSGNKEMKESKSSTVSDSKDTDSSIVNVSPNSNQLCEVYMEALMKERLSISDKCPVCTLLVGRHKHSPTPSPNNNNVDSSGSKRDGTKSAIPKWSEYKYVKPFLDRMERVLEADLVDEIHWPR